MSNGPVPMDRLKGIEAILLAATPPVVVDPSTPTRETIRRMKQARTGYVLVTDEAQLCGIFTERDVLLKVLTTENALNEPISNWMCTNPVRLEAGVSIHEAIQRMREGGFRTMPIVDQRGRIRVIRHRDLIHYFVGQLNDHVLNRPPNPDLEAMEREGG